MLRKTTLRIRRPLHALAIAAAMLTAPAMLRGQAIIEIGTGTQQNDFFGFPAPYGNALQGARHQMLILASELQAAGMSEGDITSVAFDVSNAAFVTLEGFTVSIGTTSVSDLTAAWIQGTTPVWGPLAYSDAMGWNTHTFDAPFAWDGVSNLVVQTCFYNNTANFNAQFNQSITAFNSTTVRSTNNPNVCASNGGTLTNFQLRPNMRFEWSPSQVPPVAAFSASTGSTCDGAVQFTDLSAHHPGEWFWDFGDAGTDTVQNPLHVYTSDGTFTPSLIVTNAYGSDTISGAPIQVSANGPRPIAACVPSSTGTIAGFGITSATIGSSVITSGDALSEGYADRSCHLDTVPAGTVLHVALQTGSATTHNVRVWVDWDNSGDFIAGELVLSANSVMSASTDVTVPVFALLNTPLRVRFMADYDFSPAPDPCTDLQYGQAEDYGLVVVDNPTPPVAAFSVTPQFSCSGAVQFTDASLNAPSSWTWDFGDQTSVSNEASPVHAYATSGTYTVTLIVTNIYGADTLVSTDIVTVDLAGQLVAATCAPETQGYCCGYGITSVQFAGINVSSADGSEGYQDRSCGNVANVQEGSAYAIGIGTGGSNPHDVRAWLDLNNDGDLTAAEEIFSALNVTNPNAMITIPAATVFNVPVRLRIIADVIGEVSGPCDAPLYGQTEDYSVIITPNPNPPTASFTATPTNTCTGFVQFTDGSLNAPTSWAWDFGDLQTSVEQSPLHQYLAPGVYTVTLTVTNGNGSDTQTATDLITFVEPAYCDTIPMPNFQDANSTSCEGVLSDNGGPNGNYQPGPSGAFTIAPTDAEVVQLTFSQFVWGNNPNRYLAIYDGPDVFSTLIGQFNGNGLGQLPNNGVITSSGPSITLRQEQNGGGPPPNSAGFLLTWDCFHTGLAENVADPITNVYPQPADETITIAFGAKAGTGWHLDVYDAVGGLVSQRTVSSGATEQRIDVTTLAPGFYVLNVSTPEGRWNRTIAIR